MEFRANTEFRDQTARKTELWAQSAMRKENEEG